MHFRASTIFTCFLVLAACGGPRPLGGQLPGSPFAPGGSPGGSYGVSESVDGLVVGHRLMAAGEYELALKAYYTAAGQDGLNVDVLSAIGSANLRLGRLGQAERLLRLAIKQDERFVPAWNNLGVVLMEEGKIAEARDVFQTAYALDSGKSDHIRDNLRLAIAKLGNSSYAPPKEENNSFRLVRRGHGQYLILTTPD